MSALRRPLLALAALAPLAACSAAQDETLGTTGAAATAFPNDQPAYEYFVGKGLTNFQAAAIVGNLDQESGVNPSAVQPGGPGRGIAQWSVGGRWDTAQGDNLVAYAAAQGQSTTSLTLQLEFIWFELTTFSSYGLTKLQATANVSDATVAFETDFEGCSACDEAKRIGYAEDVLSAYGASLPPRDAGASADGAPATDAAPPQPIADTGAPEPTPDTGTIDDAGEPPFLEASDGSSGCAITAAGAARGGSAQWLAGLALVVPLARRRRSKAAARSHAGR